MKRLFALVLAMLLFIPSTGCTGEAAAMPEYPAAPEEISTPVPTDEDAQNGSPTKNASPSKDISPKDTFEGTKEEVPEEVIPEEAVPEAESYARVIDPSKPMVAITFDDGPHKTYTDAILDILEENNALATFFEVGNNVRKYPEPVRRAYEMGCEVASHSNAHKNLGKMKKDAILQDLAAADAAFIAAGVPAPTMVRPPYGSVNTAVKSETGRTMVTWSIDTEDWKSRNAQKIVEYVQSIKNLDGHVILMHSIYDSTVQATETLVPWLQEQGYQLVTVTELMAYYYGELPQPNKLYGYTYFFKNGRTSTPLELPQS